MHGIYVRETWFISLSYVSRGIIIWSITTNSLRLAIPVRLSPFGGLILIHRSREEFHLRDSKTFK